MPKLRSAARAAWPAVRLTFGGAFFVLRHVAYGLAMAAFIAWFVFPLIQNAACRLRGF